MATIIATDIGQSDYMKQSLTDLHTHNLPEFDDGAKSLDIALQMLRMQKKSSVDRVALTPHYYPLREELQPFLERRQRAYDMLLSRWDGETMPDLRLGAEVRYSPLLTEINLRALTIGESDYLLLELSDTETPTHIEEVLKRMLQQGITPILAHVERCYYFRQLPDRLFDLIAMGALAQVTAKALVDRKDQKFAAACIKNGNAQIIASDIHDSSEGKACLGNISAKLNEGWILRGEEFAKAVWENNLPPAFTIKPITKTLFGYG